MLKYGSFSLLLIFIVLGACRDKSDEDTESVITNDGNFLFYNSPVAADTDVHTFIGFLSRSGGVMVKKYNKHNGKIHYVEQYKVHDYAELINKKRGAAADDHAAPALIYDIKNDRLILATSYHGTELFIYEYSLSEEIFSLLAVKKGRYTYPRFIQREGFVYLFTRHQPQGVKAGDLVVRSSSDNFSTEKVVIPSVDGEVVYASSPALSENGIYITYSVLRYESGRMHGWEVINYDPQEDQITERYNLLSYLGEKYFSNRPTAIAYEDGRLLVGTSIFSEGQKVPSRFFSRKNTVLIIEGNLKEMSDFKVVEKNIVTSPYYHTSISFDENLNFLYFDKGKVYSNITYSNDCFNYKYMMYPNFHEGGILYSIVNDGKYAIRDFDNSIIRCNKQLNLNN